MLIEDVICEKNPVVIRLPKGDIKMTRLRVGEGIRLGKMKVPGM